MIRTLIQLLPFIGYPRTLTRVLLRDTDAMRTLCLRRAKRLSNPDPARVTIVEGDALDLSALTRLGCCVRDTFDPRSAIRSSPQPRNFTARALLSLCRRIAA